MQFFVPACGSEFTLDEPWTFLLYIERRNKALFKAFGNFLGQLDWVDVDPYYGYTWGFELPADVKEIAYKTTTNKHGYSSTDIVKAAKITFMPGTKLKVARVYIRNGQKGEYDSITMTLHETTHPLLLMAAGKKKKKTYGRFWVKLIDFNKINGTIVNPHVREHLTE